MSAPMFGPKRAKLCKVCGGPRSEKSQMVLCEAHYSAYMRPYREATKARQRAGRPPRPPRPPKVPKLSKPRARATACKVCGAPRGRSSLALCDAHAKEYQRPYTEAAEARRKAIPRLPRSENASSVSFRMRQELRRDPLLPDAIVAKRCGGSRELARQVRHKLGIKPLPRGRKSRGWKPVYAALPPSGKKVLATYRNANGYRRRVCAEWIPAGAHEADADEGDGLDLVYDEARDLYTYPEGWYEVIENWDEFHLVWIHDAVTHWRELPEFPDDGREGPAGGE